MPNHSLTMVQPWHHSCIDPQPKKKPPAGSIFSRSIFFVWERQKAIFCVKRHTEQEHAGFRLIPEMVFWPTFSIFEVVASDEDPPFRTGVFDRGKATSKIGESVLNVKDSTYNRGHCITSPKNALL